jgi:flagellar protein FlaJ
MKKPRLEELKNLIRSTRSRFSKIALRRNKQQADTAESDTIKLRHLPSLIIGSRINRFLPLFRGLDINLRRSSLRINFRSYVSLAVMTSLIVSVLTLTFLTLILNIILNLPFLSSSLFSIGGGLAALAGVIIAFYAYPIYQADSIRRDLDNNITFASSYLAILAGAGVAPDSMFRSLSMIPQDLAVIRESRMIARDVDLFGLDIMTALEKASERTTSERFKELLEGLLATIRSGGDQMSYLMQRTKENMELKRISMRKFSDTLGIFSEFYVTLLIAGPLVFIVMLSVMAMLGGFGPSLMNPYLLIMLLTYIGIPFGSAIFLVVLDAVTPKW